MCRCFDRLQNISFFKDFIPRRALTRWRKVDVNLRRFSCPAGHASNPLLCTTLRLCLGMARRKKKNCYIFSSQLGADQMPGPPREGQLMCTLFLSMRQ